MTDLLRERFREQDHNEILQRDVLSVDFSLLADEAGREKITVVGNIPYSCRPDPVFICWRTEDRIRTAVLMFQKDWRRGWAASPGTKEYGIPSVPGGRLCPRFTQRLDVPATCSIPSPGFIPGCCASIFLRIPVPAREEGCFTAVVRASFASRRKTIFNNLKGVSLGLPEGSDLGDLLLAAGIDPGRRGETLSPAEFGRLSIVLLDALRKGLGNTIPV